MRSLHPPGDIRIAQTFRDLSTYPRIHGVVLDARQGCTQLEGCQLSPH